MADSNNTPFFFFFSLLLFLPLSLLLLLLLLYSILRPRPVKVPIRNRHVFISGGSYGIGLEIAHRAASEGARVSILARDRKKLEAAKQEVKLATGVDVAVYSADVRDFAGVKKAVEAAGRIDVLVCNQGVFMAAEMEEQPLEEVKMMIDVNLIGTFHLIKAALPLMKFDRRSRGPASIAIMSSQAGQIGIYGYTGYSASKFGLRGLAEALQQELIADNIHVSVICPPNTETPGLEQDNNRRPYLTKIITSSSAKMTAEEVAKKTIEGIKSGTFTVHCNFKGLLLSMATAGFTPQRSLRMAFVEVLAAGLLRLIGLFHLWSFYRIIEKWHSQKK